MGIYEKYFNTILEQDEQDTVTAPADSDIDNAEQAAMAAELEAGTPTDSFNTDVGQVEVIRKESLAKQKKILSQWVGEIEKFVEYVNGVNQTSVQAQLHNAGCDTLFEKIASSEHRRISRIAVELSGLAEALKGYLIAGEQD
jgi:hypothetical protein